MTRLTRNLTSGLLVCMFGLWVSAEVSAQIPGGPCTASRSLQVSVDASPDLDPAQPGIQVRPGTRVQLTGTSHVVAVRADCSDSQSLATLAWTLTFQPAGGEEADATSTLGPQTTQTNDVPSTTSFTATAEGTYRARIRGTATGLPAANKVVVINVPPPSAGLIQSCGKVTFLRAHDVGGGFGPPNDFIDVEIVTKLSSFPARAMGFQLRNDANEPTRHGMLDLLRDAFNNSANVCLDYFLVPGRNNGVIIRVALNK